MKTQLVSALALGAMMLCVAPLEADACTRVVYHGDSVTATGRTLDWKTPIPTALRVIPRGEHHISFDDPTDNIEWTSKYATVMAVSYNMGYSEGMNEKGLAANVLYLYPCVWRCGSGDLFGDGAEQLD